MERKIFFTLGFCFFENQKEIGKCYQFLSIDAVNRPLNKTSCEQYEFLTCMHDQGLKFCGKRREVLVNALQEMKQNFTENCKGCVDKRNNYWILDLLAFSSLVLFQKIWN
ncbi:unnamed protein product [Larinioides sclopetarius]